MALCGDRLLGALESFTEGYTSYIADIIEIRNHVESCLLCAITFPSSPCPCLSSIHACITQFARIKW
jgi:hypothetical protein